ncbi:MULTISPECIES: hypothetical protein [unclassified Chryseobacterium]|uniref:hypothetical protein n=1 Tax=unclassified Chryseobacterium TaxID=2593645 RepID=UPI00300FAD1D
MNHDIEFDYEKYIQLSLNEIESFKSEKLFKIINKDKNIEVFCTVDKSEKDDFFKCKIFLDTPVLGLDELKNNLFDHNNSLILFMLGEIFTIDYDSIITAKFSFNVPQIFTLHLNKFHSDSIQNFDNKFHRLIIPVEKDLDLDILSTKFSKIESIFSLSLFETKLDQYNYHIFKYFNDDKKETFFIIEGQEKQSFSNFRKSCESIILAFAFVAGPLIQHQNFYQTSNEVDFKNIENIFFQRKYSNLLFKRPLINPSDFKKYLNQAGEDHNKYQEFSKPFSFDTFSNLCNTIKNNSVYARSCQLVIESNNTKQYLLKAGILSIALETITTLVYEENKEKIKPIPNKQIAKNIRLDLLKEISKYKEEISEEAMKIITSKINEINKPTNSKKLAFPFEYYGITLNEIEKEILNHRNKFLHGTSPFEEVQLEEKQTELLFIISHLLFMVNSLLLKYIGYSGHIAHNPSILEYRKKIPLSDKLYKII